MQQSISGQRRRSVLKRDFAIFTVSSVSVMDLWQCISRQLFRLSCFMVLLSQFLSRLRAENVRSKVAYVKGIVKFIFKRVFWEPKGVGRSSPNFLPLPPPPPPPATPPMFVADKCEETFDLVVFFFILNFAGDRRLALLQGCWMLCFYIHARFTY